jgi:DNA-binding winged helix-turn-helix (wHTH) protein
MQGDQPLTFDRYSVDLPNAQVWRGNRVLPLTSKAFAVLRYLIEHAGQLVNKAELFAALWPGTAVSDGALTFCIVELCKALGDDAKAPRFAETMHRRGYRFIAPFHTPPPVVSPQQSATLPQLATPVVGRETELAQLHQWLAQVLSGERQLVFVTGEPGKPICRS